MRNWLADGWTYEDWSIIETSANTLENINRSFDMSVGGGGGGFNPAEVAEFAQCLRALADTLQSVASRY